MKRLRTTWDGAMRGRGKGDVGAPDRPASLLRIARRRPPDAARRVRESIRRRALTGHGGCGQS